MYRLVFLSGRYQGKRLMVRQAVTLVGHDAECHLCLPDDDQVAAQHARLEERGTGVFLEPLSPDHPIQYNGTDIQEPVRLVHDDEITIGQTRIQFQDVIASHAPARQSPGVLQPATLLFAGAILLLELALLAYLVNWPRHLIRPDTETPDLAYAEQVRAERKAEQEAKTNATAKADAPASVVTLPGTLPDSDGSSTPNPPDSAPVDVPTNTAINNPPLNPSAVVAAPTSPPSAVLEVLEEADFEAADTNTVMIELPPISQTDPRLEDAQRMLAEANAAAQFSDYAKAKRLLNQIHQVLPGYIPAHIEFARLLEARGDLDGAHQRWSQILGIADSDSPFYSLATRERGRLGRIQALQTQPLKSPQPSSMSALPRHIRIQPPLIQKMPADTDIAEMRVLTAQIDVASKAPIFKDATIQTFVTFYDIHTNKVVAPTRAITTPSPIMQGQAFANGIQRIALEATYVVPRGLRLQESREPGGRASYYGYTIHVFAGQILQDAKAKPKKLLKLPIRFSSNTPPAP
jgi:pSer/pThr/pTyr-binding forkhead associated (FHA) protein